MKPFGKKFFYVLQYSSVKKTIRRFEKRHRKAQRSTDPANYSRQRPHVHTSRADINYADDVLRLLYCGPG